MPNYRHERPLKSPVVSNPNFHPDYHRLDDLERHIARHAPWDSNDPWVRWQYLVDNGLIGANPPQPDEHAANIRRTEIILGLRPAPRPAAHTAPRVTTADPRFAPEDMA